MLRLTIDRNYVIVEGVKVDRPANLSPSQWLDIWERMIREDDE